MCRMLLEFAILTLNPQFTVVDDVKDAETRSARRLIGHEV